ncbi:hypothetical protein Gotri_002554 [Gossypium trilobum]|uniref:Uncharacterized protein n=2 Tax=Gossypium trilobum TaxID=34281 RepID=A0A7J9F8P1_9ROSI|nr:hypothetical protein [Gossypium trilobum]
MDEEDNFYNSSDGFEQQIEQMEIKCYRSKEEKSKDDRRTKPHF